MQQLVEPVRAGLTAAQVKYLIEGAPSVIVGCGLDITDLAQDDVTNISSPTDSVFGGGEVERQSYATLHGTCKLLLAQPLDWGWAVVKPWITMSDGVRTARFNLGAYFTNTPKRSRKEQPPTYDVTGYDILYALDTLVGDSYSVGKFNRILDRVEEILIARGYTKYIIDQSRADAVCPDNRVWQIGDNATWLTVVNDLLQMIGYQGVWSDWDGRLRCQPYQRPIDRPYEWYLSADEWTSILGAESEIEYDFHDAPNRWVGVRSNNIEDAPPVEGDGIVTLTNDSDGITSIEARRGLIITKRVDFEVASQADLIVQVIATADADASIPTTITTTTGTMPTAWHFDRYLVDDPGIGQPTDVLSTSWTMPLDGGEMTHNWSVLSGVRQ